ncbi:MAG: hypothetical protein ACYSSI_09310 [Planctomycetota bacterium]
MVKQLFLSFAFFLVPLVLTGCLETTVQEEPKQTKPSMDDVPDYVREVILATGGGGSWENTEEVKLEAVVTIYKPDGSYYLTEHSYRIEPWSNRIEITALEPKGKAICRFSSGMACVVKGDYRLYSLPEEMNVNFYSEMVLNITTVPLRFLDNQYEFEKKDRPIKKEGLLYYEITRRAMMVRRIRYWLDVVFYQKQENSLVDMILFSSGAGNEDFIVRGYDYYRIGKGGIDVPRKVEIFCCDSQGHLKKQLIKIDFKL